MMNGDDSGNNQGCITDLSNNYNVFQVPNKNDRLTVDDKLDSSYDRNKHRQTKIIDGHFLFNKSNSSLSKPKNTYFNEPGN
jgi:hypothetical protein